MAEQPSDASRETAKRGLASINGDESPKDTPICSTAIDEMAVVIDQDKADLMDALKESNNALEYQRLSHEWRDKERRARSEQARRDAGSMASECEEQVGNCRDTINQALARNATEQEPTK